MLAVSRRLSSISRIGISTTHAFKLVNFKLFSASAGAANDNFIQLLRAIDNENESPQNIMKLAENNSDCFSRYETIMMMFKLTKALKIYHSKGRGSITQYWTARHLDKVCRKLVPATSPETISVATSGISAEQLSMLLYSIQCLPMGNRSTEELQHFITKYISICSHLLEGAIAEEKYRFNRRQIAVSLSGLQNRSPTTDPNALSSLVNIVKLMTLHIQRDTPTMALLQTRDSADAGSSKLVPLSVLGQHMFTPRAIYNSVCGVGSLSSQFEVKRLISVLVNRLKTEQTILKAYVANANTYATDSSTGTGASGGSSSLEGIEKEYLAFQWDRSTLCGTLYSLKNFSSRDPACRELLTMLSELTVAQSLLPTVANSLVISSPELSMRDISFMCLGLQNLRSKERTVREYLRLSVIPKIDALRDFTDVDPNLINRHIGTSLYGFRYLSSDHQQVCRLLRSFNNLLDRAHMAHIQMQTQTETETAPLLASQSQPRVHSYPLSYPDMASMLYSLMSLSSSVDQVQRLLQRLTTIIAANPPGLMTPSHGGFTPRLLTMSCYGLKNCSSDDTSVRRLLGALMPHIEEFARLQTKTADESSSSTDRARMAISPRQISNMIYGTRGLSSDHGVVRHYLRLLTGLIDTSRRLSDAAGNWNTQDVSNTIYGLQNLSSSSFEVRRLLAVLTPYLKTYQPGSGTRGSVLTAQAISTCFFGLQRMTNDSTEVNALLGVLCGIFSPIVSGESRVRQPRLSGQHVGNILYGMKGMAAFSSWDPLNRSGSESKFSSSGRKVYERRSAKASASANVRVKLSSGITAGGQAQAQAQAQEDTSLVFREQICPILTRLLESCIHVNGVDSSTACVLEGQELASSVYGLQSLSLGAFMSAPIRKDGATIGYSNVAHVCGLLDAVSSVVERSSGLMGSVPVLTTSTDTPTLPLIGDIVHADVVAMPAAVSSPVILNAQEFAMVYYGLQGLYACPLDDSRTSRLEQLPPEALLKLKVQHDQVTTASRRLMRCLLPSLATCSEPVTYSELSMCCYGLIQCSSSYPEVRELISLLVRRLERFGLVASRGKSEYYNRARPVYSSEGIMLKTSARLYPYQISKLFLGLQNCSSEHAEVRQLLALLTPLLKVDIEAVTPVPKPIVGSVNAQIQRLKPPVGNPSPSGAMAVLLQDEQAWHESLRRGTGVSTHPQSKDRLSSLNVPQVLIGLRNMSRDHKEVQELIEQLTLHVDHFGVSDYV